MLINGSSDKVNVQIDEGFFFGYGVFETILVLERPVMLEAHLERLKKGLGLLGIKQNVETIDVLAQIEAMNCKNEAFKINVTPHNIICTKRPLIYHQEDYDRGYKLGTSQVVKSEKSHIAGIKSMNYMDNLIENRLAKANGLDDVVFYNTRGMVTESSFSNIFIIKGGRIYTPPTSSGLLEGTMRQWVLDNFQVLETPLFKDDFIEAEGAFLTNSLMGIMKISQYEDKMIDDNPLRVQVSDKLEIYFKKYR